MGLLAIFAGYSSTIYAENMDITWEKEQREVPFESYEDLDRSGLPLYVANSDFVWLADVLEGPLSAMKNRIVQIDDPFYYGMTLAEDQNLSCLMKKSYAETALRSTLGENGRATSKLVKPCLHVERGLHFPVKEKIMIPRELR